MKTKSYDVACAIVDIIIFVGIIASLVMSYVASKTYYEVEETIKITAK